MLDLSSPVSTLFSQFNQFSQPNYNNASNINLSALSQNTNPVSTAVQSFVSNMQPSLNQTTFNTGLTLSQSNNTKTAFTGQSMMQDASNKVSNISSSIFPTDGIRKLSFNEKFANSTFGKNYGAWSTGLNTANTLFTGVFGEKSEYDGEKGDVTRSMDSAYDTVQNFAGTIPGVGQAISLGMGANKLLGNIVNKLGAGTDGMTNVDSILGSSLLQLTPFGLINGFGGKRADTITKNDEVFEQVGSSYTGSESNVNNALSKSGKKYGLFSSSAREEANRQIAEAKRQQSIIENIADEATDVFAASNSMAAINENRRKYYLQGGYNQANVRVGRSGMSLDLIAKAKKILGETRQLKNGGKVTPTKILLVVPEFQDGGQINKKSRTLQELIEYAKKENPRFIQRMSEPLRYIDLGNGNYATHLMGYEFDPNTQKWYVYSQVQEDDNGNLKLYDFPEAFNRALEKKNVLEMTQDEAKLFTESEELSDGTFKGYKAGWPNFFKQKPGKFQQGGSINIIPEGALHAHKHNMDMEGITPKGIPVVSNKEGGEVDQQAEIEREEIIFRLEVTKKLEELEKKFYDSETSQKEKDECALEAGKLLVEEILYNTQDNTNKLL